MLLIIIDLHNIFFKINSPSKVIDKKIFLKKISYRKPYITSSTWPIDTQILADIIKNLSKNVLVESKQILAELDHCFIYIVLILIIICFK